MKTLIASFAAATLLSIAGCATLLPNQVPTDTRMTGTWVPLNAELGGKKYEFVKDFRLVVDGDHFTANGGTQRDVGKLLFFGGDPRGVDVVGEEGPNTGQRLPAIYRFAANGDMEICYDLSRTARPVEFASRPNTRLFRITYRKAG